MRVTHIRLWNFRNYARADIEPCPGVTVLHGDNAQGKTSVLEAVYLCCTGRSHRTPRDREMILRGEQSARVIVEAERLDGSHAVDIRLFAAERKEVRVGGTRISRSGEILGHVYGVLFSPEDLRMVKDGPAERRRFVDMELSQLNPSYYYALQRYNRALKQRGALLRDSLANPSLLKTLPAWDEQLAWAGAVIIDKRRAFLEKLGTIAGEIHAAVSGDREKLAVRYHFSPADATADSLYQALEQNRESDARRGVTSVGPHRDDVVFTLDGADARAYGSQGQQRTLALALKLSELRVMRDETGEWPLLMLDDVMSELDPGRRRQLLSHIEGVQTLVTCTDPDDLAGAQVGKMLEISGGNVADADNETP